MTAIIYVHNICKSLRDLALCMSNAGLVTYFIYFY